jgi:hypothetical protein
MSQHHCVRKERPRAQPEVAAARALVIRSTLAMVFICSFLCAMFGFVCSVQVVATQSMGVSQVAAATGSVSGHVIMNVGGAGLRKVIVVLGAQAGEEKREYTTSTDAFGQFRIEDVQPGTYSVTLRRSGYLRAQEKATDAEITVSAGQEVKGLVYQMQPAGVIAGKITEPDGDPLPGVSVWVTRVGSHGPEVNPNGPNDSDAGEEITNDLGEFRIANLRAGQYIVQAQTHGTGPAPDPALRGRQKDRAIYALTFYPGTLEMKQASAVQVAAGGTATANFSVLTSGAYRVSGIVAVTGNPRNMQIFLVATSGQTEEHGLGDGGKFEFQNVLPGTYVAQIVDMSPAEPGFPPVAHTRIVASPIIVSDGDVTGLQLRLEVGGSVKGHVRTEDGETLDWKNLNLSLVRVSDGSAELPQMESLGESGATVALKEDGSFELSDVAGATYQVVLEGQSEKFRDYYLKSLQVDGREAVDTGFAVNGEMNLDVVVSGKAASIEGTVVDGKGNPVSGATVVSLPSASKAARLDGYQTEKADGDGHFVMRGMSPGAYQLVALQGTPGDVRKPEFAEKYGERAQTVDLAEGNKTSVTVTVVEEE